MFFNKSNPIDPIIKSKNLIHTFSHNSRFINFNTSSLSVLKPKYTTNINNHLNNHNSINKSDIESSLFRNKKDRVKSKANQENFSYPPSSMNKSNNTSSSYEAGNYFKNIEKQISSSKDKDKKLTSRDNRDSREFRDIENIYTDPTSVSSTPNSREYQMEFINTFIRCDICTKTIDLGNTIKFKKCENCCTYFHIACAKDFGDNKCEADSYCKKCLIDNDFNLACFVCNKNKGSMIKCDNKWMHIICMWLLKDYFTKKIDSLSSFSFDRMKVKDKQNKACNLCNYKSGYTVRCINGCGISFHPYCGFSHNFDFFLSDKRQDVGNIFYRYDIMYTCEYHQFYKEEIRAIPQQTLGFGDAKMSNSNNNISKSDELTKKSNKNVKEKEIFKEQKEKSREVREKENKENKEIKENKEYRERIRLAIKDSNFHSMLKINKSFKQTISKNIKNEKNKIKLNQNDKLFIDSINYKQLKKVILKNRRINSVNKINFLDWDFVRLYFDFTNKNLNLSDFYDKSSLNQKIEGFENLIDKILVNSMTNDDSTNANNSNTINNLNNSYINTNDNKSINSILEFLHQKKKYLISHDVSDFKRKKIEELDEFKRFLNIEDINANEVNFIRCKKQRNNFNNFNENEKNSNKESSDYLPSYDMFKKINNKNNFKDTSIKYFAKLLSKIEIKGVNKLKYKDNNMIDLENLAIAQLKGVYSNQLESIKLSDIDYEIVLNSQCLKETYKRNQEYFETCDREIENEKKQMNYPIFEEDKFRKIEKIFKSVYCYGFIKRRLKKGLKDKTIEQILKTRSPNCKVGKAMSTEYKHKDNTTIKFSSLDTDCCVCLYTEFDDTAPIVFCDSCNVSIHTECYGVKEIPTDEFFCSKCEFKNIVLRNRITGIVTEITSSVIVSKLIMLTNEQIALYFDNICCEICLRSKGAMKSIDSSFEKWVHSHCVIMSQGYYFSDYEKMKISINKLPISKELDSLILLKCEICKKEGGEIVKCQNSDCYVTFHTMCAYFEGYQIELVDNNKGDTNIENIIVDVTGLQSKDVGNASNCNTENNDSSSSVKFNYINLKPIINCLHHSIQTQTIPENIDYTYDNNNKDENILENNNVNDNNSSLYKRDHLEQKQLRELIYHKEYIEKKVETENETSNEGINSELFDNFANLQFCCICYKKNNLVTEQCRNCLITYHQVNKYNK